MNNKLDLLTEVEPSAKLIIKNLAFECTKSELHQLLSTFGQVKSLRLPKKFDGSHRGFAFVEYMTKEEAKNAMKHLAHSHFYSRHLVLSYSKTYDLFDSLDHPE